MIMRRFHARENDDIGPWRGLGEIRRAHGGTKDEVRGLLIELVAAGEVETLSCTSGVFWCAARPAPVPPLAIGPLVFVLQRRLPGSGDHWFDAEAFDTKEKALAQLQYRRREAQAWIDGRGGSGYTGQRPQRMRVIHLVSEAGTAKVQP
jgi:hypothetical protein